MHSVTVTPLPHAGEPNHPARVACVADCEQLATVNWHFAHDTGTSGDNPLCPTHAGEWAQAYADPDAEEWLGQ